MAKQKEIRPWGSRHKTFPEAYKSWITMRQRCLNKNHYQYHRYGGRGITVCDRWMKFDNFAEDMGERPTGHSIDRINNDGNYDPFNCRWATREQQLANKSSSNGLSKKTHCLRGHPFSGDNLRIRKNGARDCVACIKERGRLRYL